MSYTLAVEGLEATLECLERVASVKLDAAVRKSVTQMRNRAMDGGTPFRSGELRKSANVQGKGADMEMGYSKEYAAHVEYGHRTVNGGYVEGQYYLKANLEKQQPIFYEDCREAVGRVIRGK